MHVPSFAIDPESLMKKLVAAIVFGALLVATAAQAQTSTRIRASVISFDGRTLVVRTAVGKEITTQVTDNTRITYNRPIRLSDIKEGDFVGSAAMPGPDGKLVAREVHLFPESQRGSGEGSNPMQSEPGAIMTNATVAKLVMGTGGQELTLQYKGGAKTIIVPEATPVVTFAQGDKSLLVPGSAVTVSAQTAPDGTVTAVGISATGKDGTRPF
jgi:hypothetical protein